MIKAVLDWVIIKPISPEAKTESGIHIAVPEKMPNKGTIVSTGKDVKNKFTVGEVVLFKKWVANEITYQKEKLLVLKEADVLARSV